jgi:hypothetical protein
LAIVVIGGGFLIGIVVGRWWAFLVPAVLGIWAGLTFTDLEVPAAWIGLIYAGGAAIGVLLGLVTRRALARSLRGEGR